MPNSVAGESIIQRVARVLAAFDADSTGLTIAEISRRADLPESTARRMVGELIDEGILARQDARLVGIGHRLWAQVSRTSPTLKLRDAAIGYMDDIQTVVGHHTTLSVLDGDEALYIERLGSRNSTTSIANVASRLPWHTVSAGWVLVANDDRSEEERRLRRRLIAHTDATITDPAVLRAKLADVRRTGYAVCAAMSVPASTGISVPVRGGTGEVVAALGVIVPVAENRVPSALPLLMAASRGISRALGWAGGSEAPGHWRSSHPMSS
ncbi:IclR family transcriptional regulator [Microbacterium gorillae]|uniref:IclR family transcriptional regulator n=1 Tax=Microbacterium gorillae TaxID=1231063 RepID=UPI00058FBB0A|nr:IclR family transcriptional regulator [Microbacterium gorillae]